MRWGPAPLEGGGRRFRLWAPACEALGLRLNGAERAMAPAGDGWFALDVPEARPGDAYAFVLPSGLAVPDPASRRQAGDVHGPSVVADEGFEWGAPWAGRPWAEAVIYEMHIGTFTPEGTFRAAMERLDALVEAGVTALEILPVAQFGGRRGWGYDGVLPYCPHEAYGSPDDMRAFVAAAQGRGLMVLLDVVYNHFGPDGNYLGAYAPEFFDEGRRTPWGAAIRYEEPSVRAFFVENLIYWLEAFRLDGLRLDAIDHVRDEGSRPEILVEMARAVRARDWGRPIHLTTEDNRNVTHLHRREAGRVALYTGEWNDDVHNAAHVALTGETEGYYADYADAWRLLAEGLAHGFAYGGQVSPTGGQPRGEDPTVLPPLAFIDFLQNHDQIGNRAFGERLTALADPGLVRAFTAILLLSPHVPLMFQGDEWGSRGPFLFFADFGGDLGRAVREGRRREFADFAAFARGTDGIPDPVDPATFAASRLDWAERESPQGRAHLAFVRRLLDLRAARIVPQLAEAGPGGGRVVAAGEGLLAVDWALGGGTLHLRAAMGAAGAPGAPGEVLSSLEEGPMRVVHAWSAT